jgi:FkbM family methyltransferase
MISYSQPATKQDLWVIDRLKGKRGGKYVEIGAHDGVRHSNTKMLEDYFGWNGLLVEPQYDLYVECIRNRKNDANNLISQWVIGRTARERVFFFKGNSYGGIAEFMPQDWKDEHFRRRTEGDYRETQTLRRLLEHHKMPDHVDYLSLDVEGAELPILEGFFTPLSEYDTYVPERWFSVITVEFRYDDVLLSRLEDLLEANGYILEHVEAFDAFFVNKRLRDAQCMSRAA